MRIHRDSPFDARALTLSSRTCEVQRFRNMCAGALLRNRNAFRARLDMSWEGGSAMYIGGGLVTLILIVLLILILV